MRDDPEYMKFLDDIGTLLKKVSNPNISYDASPFEHLGFIQKNTPEYKEGLKILRAYQKSTYNLIGIYKNNCQLSVFYDEDWIEPRYLRVVFLRDFTLYKHGLKCS